MWKSLLKYHFETSFETSFYWTSFYIFFEHLLKHHLLIYFTHLFYSSIYSSICPSICPSICSSIYSSIYPSIWTKHSKTTLLNMPLNSFISNWVFLQKPEEEKHLKCYLSDQQNPYLILQPVKIEVFHTKPYIVIFHDLLTDKVSRLPPKLFKVQISNFKIYFSFDRNPTWSNHLLHLKYVNFTESKLD